VSLEISIWQGSDGNAAATEARLMALVLNGVTSEHSRRAYRTGLIRFFAWIRVAGQGSAFTKATVQQYRAALIAVGLSASTINLRLSPIRKLARELADNQRLDPQVASAIVRVPGVVKRGIDWLLKFIVPLRLDSMASFKTCRNGTRPST
jgi:integrase/recombinase XerD